MKFLLAMLVLMLLAPPVQALGCDMASGDEAAMHAAMGHGAMQDHKGATASGHDCCASPQAAGGGDSCADMSCAACVVAVAAIPSLAASANLRPASQVPAFDNGAVSPSHASPPFRPPISLC
jgi:hypothetical protein